MKKEWRVWHLECSGADVENGPSPDDLEEVEDGVWNTKKEAEDFKSKTTWKKGKKLSEETKRKMSESRKGIPWTKARWDAQNKKRGKYDIE